MLGLLMLMHHPVAVSHSVADVLVAAEEEKKNTDKLKFPLYMHMASHFLHQTKIKSRKSPQWCCQYVGLCLLCFG